METKYLIEKEVVEALIEYLAKRPWAEVNQAMPKLMNLELHQPEKEESRHLYATNDQ